MNYTIRSNSYNTTTSRTTPVTAAAAAAAAASSLAPTTPTPTYTNAVEAYSSPLFFLSFLIIAFSIILFIRLLQIRNKEQQQLKFDGMINNITTNANNNNNNGEGASNINNGTTGTGTEVGGNHHHHHDLSNSDIVSRSNSGSNLNFSLEDRIELYNKTFNSNGNQLILEGKHIKTKTTIKTIASKSINECGSISGNKNYSIFLDIELGGKGNNYNEEYEDEDVEEHDDDDDDDDDDNNPSIYLSIELEHGNGLTAVTTSSTHLNEDNKDNKEQQMISSDDGTCIVCFEKFIKDDIIVWSTDPNCFHIYTS